MNGPAAVSGKLSVERVDFHAFACAAAIFARRRAGDGGPDGRTCRTAHILVAGAARHDVSVRVDDGADPVLRRAGGREDPLQFCRRKSDGENESHLAVPDHGYGQGHESLPADRAHRADAADRGTRGRQGPVEALAVGYGSERFAEAAKDVHPLHAGRIGDRDGLPQSAIRRDPLRRPVEALEIGLVERGENRKRFADFDFLAQGRRHGVGDDRNRSCSLASCCFAACVRDEIGDAPAEQENGNDGRDDERRQKAPSRTCARRRAGCLR